MQYLNKSRCSSQQLIIDGFILNMFICAENETLTLPLLFSFNLKIIMCGCALITNGVCDNFCLFEIIKVVLLKSDQFFTFLF